MPSKPIWKYMDCKVFVDSDSDVRLSRRIYKDTQDDGVELSASIDNYLQNIKPSYEAEIEPCKITSDIIIPHFGGGYNDHRKKCTQICICRKSLIRIQHPQCQGTDPGQSERGNGRRFQRRERMNRSFWSTIIKLCWLYIALVPVWDNFISFIIKLL